MNWRKIVVGIAGALALWGAIWVVVQFCTSEEAQMLKAHNKFIAALEARKWWTVDSMVSKDYSDTVQDAATVKAGIHKVLGGFYVLSIKQSDVKTRLAKSQGKIWLGYVSAKLKLEGSGAGFSGAVVSSANGLNKPWFFHWHRRSLWPWAWELVQVHNDDLGKLGSVAF